MIGTPIAIHHWRAIASTAAVVHARLPVVWRRGGGVNVAIRVRRSGRVGTTRPCHGNVGDSSYKYNAHATFSRAGALGMRRYRATSVPACECSKTRRSLPAPRAVRRPASEAIVLTPACIRKIAWRI